MDKIKFALGKFSFPFFFTTHCTTCNSYFRVRFLRYIPGKVVNI
jgi:hypothetical protein